MTPSTFAATKATPVSSGSSSGSNSNSNSNSDPTDPTPPQKPTPRLPVVVDPPRNTGTPGRTVTPSPGQGTGLGTRAPYGLGTGLPQGSGSSGRLLPLPPVLPPHSHQNQQSQLPQPVQLPWWYTGWGGDYWNNTDDGNGTGFTGSSDSGQGPTQVPPMIPGAPADSNVIQSTDAAQGTMAQIRTLKETQMEASPEWRSAIAALNQAQSDLDAANAQAKDALSSNSDYKALLDKRSQIEAEIARIHRTVSDPSPDMLTPLAQDDMNAGAKLTRMESKLLADDPGVIDAKKRIADARGKLDALKKEVDAQVMGDPNWQAAHQQVLQASR